jgi:hypothetical protein
MTRIVIERRTAYGAQKHSRRGQASLQSVRWQRIVRRSERRSTDQSVLKVKFMAKAVGNRLQNEHSLLGNFRANAVAWEDGEIQEHRDDWVIW